MKFEVENSNYAATIVRIGATIGLEGCDNVVGFPIFGYQAVVSKNTKIGDLMVLFTAETQLSEEYCRVNNLFRKKELNADQTVAGYIEENRRIKALKFRGHKSSALVMPLSSLSYILGDDSKDLKEGVSFQKIDGVEVCKKYNLRQRGEGIRGNNVRGKNKRFERVEPKLFPEHLDSDNFFKNAHKYKSNDFVVVTQKLHGTSGRFGNILVKRNKSLFEKALNFVGIKTQDTEYDYIAGSRRVIKDPNGDQEQKHYFDSDIWTQKLNEIKTNIPKNTIIYGEIIGWAGDNSLIQKNYSYQMPQGSSELYIYRMVNVNPDGYCVDYSWQQIKEFCKSTGLKNCPELWSGRFEDFNAQDFLDKKYFKEMQKDHFMYNEHPVPLDDNSPCDEGACVRVEQLQPYITKAKSPMFLEHETKLLDSGVEDLESQQS
jgi:hypothetical protein